MFAPSQEVLEGAAKAGSVWRKSCGELALAGTPSSTFGTDRRMDYELLRDQARHLGTVQVELTSCLP